MLKQLFPIVKGEMNEMRQCAHLEGTILESMDETAVSLPISVLSAVWVRFALFNGRTDCNYVTLVCLVTCLYALISLPYISRSVDLSTLLDSYILSISIHVFEKCYCILR